MKPITERNPTAAPCDATVTGVHQESAPPPKGVPLTAARCRS